MTETSPFPCVVCGATQATVRIWGETPGTTTPQMAVVCEACSQRYTPAEIAAMGQALQAVCGTQDGPVSLMAQKQEILAGLLHAAAHTLPDGWWERRADEPPPSGTVRAVDLHVRKEAEPAP
jgi:hypothetical protein